jgi:hypothetical protein
MAEDFEIHRWSKDSLREIVRASGALNHGGASVA